MCSRVFGCVWLWGAGPAWVWVRENACGCGCGCVCVGRPSQGNQRVCVSQAEAINMCVRLSAVSVQALQLIAAAASSIRQHKTNVSSHHCVPI
jgi:hypothetical protein